MDKSKLVKLTPAEIRTLEGLCADKTGYAMAIEDNVSEPTISKRIGHAMKKLGVKTRHGLAVTYDRLRGAVSDDDEWD